MEPGIYIFISSSLVPFKYPNHTAALPVLAPQAFILCISDFVTLNCPGNNMLLVMSKLIGSLPGSALYVCVISFSVFMFSSDFISLSSSSLFAVSMFIAVSPSAFKAV